MQNLETIPIISFPVGSRLGRSDLIIKTDYFQYIAGRIFNSREKVPKRMLFNLYCFQMD